MNDKSRMAALAGTGAAIAASSAVLMKGTAFLGLSADFWRGVPVGIGIGLALLAVASLVRSRSAL